VCTLVVRFRDDVKFLLARSVPKLYLDSLPAVINMLGFEIDPEAKKMRRGAAVGWGLRDGLRGVTYPAVIIMSGLNLSSQHRTNRLLFPTPVYEWKSENIGWGRAL
jgi:hypothetical protein